MNRITRFDSIHISNFDEDKDYKAADSHSSFTDLDASGLEVADKWELWMRAQNMMTVLDEWDTLFQKLLPILKRYHMSVGGYFAFCFRICAAMTVNSFRS